MDDIVITDKQEEFAPGRGSLLPHWYENACISHHSSKLTPIKTPFPRGPFLDKTKRLVQKRTYVDQSPW